MAFARAVNTMGLSLVMTFLGIYIVKPRGYPASVYGVIALAANLAQSMANAWAGSLSDRIGRRPRISTALFVPSGFVALLGTQVLPDAPLRTLGATMVVSATLRGCFEPVAYALVADVVREDQRVTAFGIQRMGTNLGWALGPALGLIRRLGIRTTLPWSSFLAGFGFALIGLASGFMGGALAILIVTAAEVVFDDLRANLRSRLRSPRSPIRRIAAARSAWWVSCRTSESRWPRSWAACCSMRSGDHHAAMWLVIARDQLWSDRMFLAFRAPTHTGPTNEPSRVVACTPHSRPAHVV